MTEDTRLDNNKQNGLSDSVIIEIVHACKDIILELINC